jgi:hypothetical protein
VPIPHIGSSTPAEKAPNGRPYIPCDIAATSGNELADLARMLTASLRGLRDVS